MSQARLPEWIREKKINLESLREIKTLLREKSLHSVCESLACPNRTECFSRGTATFMILGDVCTRSCGFCNVTTGRPYAPPSPDEPRHVADAARRMKLRHVVVTCVTRDDLPDGGAHQFAATIRALRLALPKAAVEVLTSDFRGNSTSVRTVVEAKPDYFNHNVETVPRLYDFVRPGSRFERSLRVLREAKQLDSTIVTKSGLMLGLGERRDEVVGVLRHLRETGVEIVTIGQYLQPKKEKLDVVEYVRPEVFAEYERM
ncbi:MAG TPA: lipoyl synthase, partial [Thermoanaerobaculia bacterium]